MTSPGMLHRERFRQGVEGEIPSRYDDAHLLTRQFLPHGVCRGEGGRSGSLSEHPRRLEQSQDATAHFRIRYETKIVQPLPKDLGRETERDPRCQAFSKRICPVDLLQLAAAPGLKDDRRAGCLHADDPQLGRQTLAGKAGAGQPGAATGGDDQHIQIRHGFQHLYGIRRDSRNQTPIICWPDKVRAARSCIALGLGPALIEIQPAKRTSAPRRRIDETFRGFASSGIQTVAGAPNSRAAYAIDCPWLPVDAVTIPRARSSADSSLTRKRPPRTLNAPMGWRFSHLRND